VLFTTILDLRYKIAKLKKKRTIGALGSLISCVRHCIEGDRTFSRSWLLICALAIALAKASPKHRA
jgi:hypothetical protein